ncbi:TonB-dependent siderophore receptor [Marinomonas polaris]|uniref:TonB-dependent siderophore receptor n=1 Tax=Marinomonas polaris TaxID=293552 RepID=UPI003F99A783
MNKKSTLPLKLKQSHCAAATLFCYSVLTPIAGYAETESEAGTFRLSPIMVNDQAIADDDSESIVAKELWIGGKVATSIQDTPASVSVITEKEIKQRDASTTEEILEYSPGMVTGYYAADDRNDYFQIRGFSATTYRDGLTLGSMRGIREDAYAFERVEVIRGANSTLFGPADPGGSINFVSKQPKFYSFNNAFVTYGSNDHKEVGIDVGDTLDEDKTLAYRLTGKVKDSDREYDHSKDDSEFFMGGLTWEPTDYTKASLIIDYLKTDSTPNSGGSPTDKEYSRSNFYGEPDFNYHNVDRTSIAAMINHNFNNGFKAQGNLRYYDANESYAYLYLNDSSTRTTSEVPRGSGYGKSQTEQFIGNLIGQYDKDFGRIDSSTLLGVEYLNSSKLSGSNWGTADSIDVDNVVYSGAPTTTNIEMSQTDYVDKAVFLQQNIALDDRFIAAIGIRQDDVTLKEDESSDFSETSMRYALTYKVNKEFSTYISQVESVSPPSDGTKLIRGEQIEVGAKYAPSNMNALFSVAVYDLVKKNSQINIYDGTEISRETIGENQTKGIDLEVKAELTDSLSMTAGYSYMDSEVIEDDKYEGNKFVTAPHHIASLWSHYVLPRQDMTVGLGARYTGSYYFDAANTSKSEATVLFDASFSYNLSKDTNVSMNISNILDEQHQVGGFTAAYYNPSRDITLTLNHSW